MAKTVKATPVPARKTVVELNETEKGIVSELIRKEKFLESEAAKLRSNVADIVMMIASRAGMPANAKLNLDTDKWSISIREV